MSDVARQAGVTRQTVYNVFGSSDAVLRGAIRLYVDGQWRAILDRWADCRSLAEKLDVLLLHFAVEPWEFLNSSAEAAQLERGYNEAGRDEIEEARLRFRGDIAELFLQWEDALIGQGTTPLAVADFIGASIEGIKYNSRSRDDMLLAVATLKASLLALTR